MVSFLFQRNVRVIEEGRTIEITGVPAYLIDRDIAKVWGTRKLQMHMFMALTRNKIVIPSFFALDLIYILEQMIVHGAKLYSDREVLKRTVEEIRAQTWLAQIDAEHASIFNYKHLSEISYKLLDHQRRFLAWYDYVKPRYGLKGILLTAAAGGGKTITGIATALCREAEATIIISPKNAIYEVWEDTLVNKMTKPQDVYVVNTRKLITDKTKWFIYNYEALDQAIALKKQLGNKRIVIILDESHNFNDPESLRTRRFEELCKGDNITDVIFSSGTPIKAMGTDSIPLMRVIDPMFTANVEMRFRKIFGKDAKKANDVLANRLGIISYKVTKDQFMPTKPIEYPMPIKIPDGDYYTLDKIRERVTKFIAERVKYYEERRKGDFEYYYWCLTEHYEPKINRQGLEAHDYEQYKQYVDIFVKQGFDPRSMSEMSVFCNKFEKEVIIPKLPQEHRAAFKDVKSAVKYPQLKVRGEALGRVLGKERIDANIKVALAVDYENIIAGAVKKVICFSSYVRVVDAVDAHLKKLKLKPLKVHAETNKDLTSIISQFTNKKEINPLLATFQSLSTAVPVTAANVVVALNATFRVHEMEQAIARAWRIGQDAQVVVYHVILDTGTEANISSRSADIMAWSKEQVDAIMGYDSTTDIDISVEDYPDVLGAFERRMEYLNSTCISQEDQSILITKYREDII